MISSKKSDSELRKTVNSVNYSENLNTYRKMLEFIEGRMTSIESISLEEDEYNELYLALRAARNEMTKVIRAQYAVDKVEAEGELWTALKGMRSPNDSIKV